MSVQRFARTVIRVAGHCLERQVAAWDGGRPGSIRARVTVSSQGRGSAFVCGRIEMFGARHSPNNGTLRRPVNELWGTRMGPERILTGDRVSQVCGFRSWCTLWGCLVLSRRFVREFLGDVIRAILSSDRCEIVF